MVTIVSTRTDPNSCVQRYQVRKHSNQPRGGREARLEDGAGTCINHVPFANDTQFIQAARAQSRMPDVFTLQSQFSSRRQTSRLRRTEQMRLHHDTIGQACYVSGNVRSTTAGRQGFSVSNAVHPDRRKNPTGAFRTEQRCRTIPYAYNAPNTRTAASAVHHHTL
jgi:hypothetical protein